VPRPPAIQWYYKQWLGDNKVLAMDWDAQAMHFHLLMMSIQEEPAGSIPNDVGQIRRWLRLPSGQSDSDRVWARVQPQIFAAWTLQDGRWFNAGMRATMERVENYRSRYENGTKKAREPMHIEEELIIKASSKTERPSFEQVRDYCLERKNAVDPQQWLDYYSANGWKVGKSTMKDWRAAVRTWERNGFSKASKQDSMHEFLRRNGALDGSETTTR
jgi:hypothetical protein